MAHRDVLGVCVMAINEALRDELIERAAADQAALKESLKANQRLGWGPLDDSLMTPKERRDLAETRRILRENVARLAEIVESFGWPDSDLVGDDGAAAAWLLAQHADSNRDLLARYVELMKTGYRRGVVKGDHLASLSDRVALATGRPQTYATQLHVVDGRWEVREPCDIEAARRLRADLGLPTIEEAIAELSAELEP